MMSMRSSDAMWRGVLMAMLLAVAGWLAGCNTMEGAGKDVEKAGEAVQDAAN